VASKVLPRVIVTGAAGRTGSLVFSKLLQSGKYNPIGILRTKESLKKLSSVGASSSNTIVCDITNTEDLYAAFEGADKVILCTSAIPKVDFLSIPNVLIAKILGKTAVPKFTYPSNGSPYDVDWIGAKNQIDAAKKAKVKQFVFLSSMGGTDPNNFLNTMGRKDGDEKSGNILLWKRKAEKYLIDSGIPYTIVHPGGLLDKQGGEREIVFGINDELLKEKVKSIPRADVAEVCVQALDFPNALTRSFDIISRAPGEGKTMTDWKSFFSQRGNCKY